MDHTSAPPMEVIKSFIDFISINEGITTLRQLIKTDFKIEELKVNGLGHKENNIPQLTKPSNCSGFRR